MRKLIEQLTRKPRAAPVPKSATRARDRAMQDAQVRLARLRDDMRETRDGFIRGDIDLDDLAQE